MIHVAPVTLGCDPEAFLMKGGKVIGAEKVIPEKGLHSKMKYAAIVLDGVQLEVHTNPKSRPDGIGLELTHAFSTLKEHLHGMDNISVCFSSVVTMEREELDSLSEGATISHRDDQTTE